MKHSKREEAKLILAFVGFIWLVFLADVFLPLELASFGLTPRSAAGLVGIVTMPFLHGGWNHIISNTVPLCVLLFLLAGSRSGSAAVVVGLIVAGGSLLWLVGRADRTHVGASGLIYGLIAFLLVAGFREGRFVSLVVAVVTGLLYGGSLFYGVLPTAEPGVSWEGHLTGAVAGAMVATQTVRRSA